MSDIPGGPRPPTSQQMAERRVIIPGSLMRRPELESVLGVGTSTLYRWMAVEGFPRPLRVGGAALWQANRVLLWLQERGAA